MIAGYVLSAAAEADLREIVRYTRREWSDAQARRYLAKLKTGIEKFCAGHRPSTDMASLRPGLRVARCEHHHIFFLARADAPALVVAILHERMDLIVRLGERLR